MIRYFVHNSVSTFECRENDESFLLFVSQNGLFSALPYVVKYFVSFAFSWLADFLNNGHYISLSLNRKIANSVGEYSNFIHSKSY